jgi:hypothetical protein
VLDDHAVVDAARALLDDPALALFLLERPSDSATEAAEHAVLATLLAKQHPELAGRAARLVDVALPRAARLADKVELHRARATLLDAAGQPDVAAAERAEAARLDSR